MIWPNQVSHHNCGVKSFDKSLSKKVETSTHLRLEFWGLNIQTRKKKKKNSAFSLKKTEHLKSEPASHALGSNQQFGLGSARQFFFWFYLGSLMFAISWELIGCQLEWWGNWALSSCSRPARLIYLVVMHGSQKQRERINSLMHKNLSSFCFYHICY